MKVPRKLDVGADGMTNVTLLTQPIPRHVSLVDWGANNAPAVSWKAADPTAAHLILRTPPSGKVADPTQVDGPTLRDFIGETVDAWMACLDSVFATPLQPGDRAAQIRALTVQAGARIAAAVKVIGLAAESAAAAHKSAGLKVPEVPTATTLAGEIDRRRLRSAMEYAAAYLIDSSLEAAKTSATATEIILSNFAVTADAFSSAASSLPAGVVGALSAAKKTARTESPPETPMTLEQLQALAAANPIKFLETIRMAVVAAKAAGPEGVSVAKKFMWGETGVEPYEPGEILSSLVGFQSGEALAAAIATAVGGIDVNKAAGTGISVASSMKAGLSKLMVHEMKTAPDGEFSTALKELMAPVFAEAMIGTFRAAIDGGHFSGGSPGIDPMLDFKPEEGAEDDLIGQIPGLKR